MLKKTKNKKKTAGMSRNGHKHARKGEEKEKAAETEDRVEKKRKRYGGNNSNEKTRTLRRRNLVAAENDGRFELLSPTP